MVFPAKDNESCVSSKNNALVLKLVECLSSLTNPSLSTLSTDSIGQLNCAGSNNKDEHADRTAIEANIKNIFMCFIFSP
jgi:hypothetical protein